MTLEERMLIIEKKANKIRQEELDKNLAKKNATTEALNKVKELEPRIKALITIANKCINEGIDFPSSNEIKTKFGYGDGLYDFIADGVFHHVGFMATKKGCWLKGESRYNPINYIGIVNGGANGPYDFYTIGDDSFFTDGEKDGPYSLSDIEKFLNQFDAFEEAFYKWIDSMAE